MKNYSEIKALDFEETTNGDKATFIQKRSSVSKGELTCVVMVANEIDAHGDMFTVECVRKAYEDYVNEYNTSNKSHGVQHTGNQVDAQLLSHWFTEIGGNFDGVEAPQNSFIAKFKINEEEVKKQYETGSLTGVSIEANATVIPFAFLEERGYTINDCMSLTKSKVKNSKHETPKRIILKTKINKIDFVDMGANLRVGLYKSIKEEELPAQIEENIEKQAEYDIVNDILDDELSPSVNFSINKNLALKEKRSKLFGISNDKYGTFYIPGVEKYELEYYLDPVNLRYEVKTNEQMSYLLSCWESIKYNYSVSIEPNNDFFIIQKRLTKILLDNNYDISYDYIKTSLDDDFDESLLQEIKDKYNKEGIKEPKMEFNKEMLDAVRQAVEQITAEKAALEADKEKQLKIIQEQEAKANIEKAEKESLQNQIKELQTKFDELLKTKTEQKNSEQEVKVEKSEEPIETKIEKAIEARLEKLIARSNTGTNVEVEKSTKTHKSALDGFFDK